MNRHFPVVPLGEVLQLKIDAVPVDPSDSYMMAGVYSFGRGLFRRGPLLGAETTYKFLHRLHKDYFVISQPKAWEGALARVPNEFDGLFLSSVFPTFRAILDRLDVRYLEWYCKQAIVWEELRSKARGMGARRESVLPNQFLSLTIPLPTLSEQRRIVAKIDELATKIQEARTLRQQAAEQGNVLFSRSTVDKFTALRGRFPNRPLGDLISMASGEGLTSSQMNEAAPYLVYGGGGVTGRYSEYLFEEPKIAIGRVGARCGCVFVTEPKSWITDNALYLAEISADLYSPYLVHALSTSDIRGQANQAAQPVVSQKKINPLTIPVPPISEQQRVVGELDALQAEVDALRRLQAESVAELDALLPSILDKAFKGKL